MVDLRTQKPNVFIRFALKEACSISLQLPIALAVTVALGFSPNVSPARAQQKSLTPDQMQIVDTVSTIFSAVGAEDIAKLNSVIAPDFYIFANGMRFNGDALMAAIKALHAAGKRNNERVTEPDIRISGNTAAAPPTLPSRIPVT